MRRIVLSTQSTLLSSMLTKELKIRGIQTEHLSTPPAEEEIVTLCRSVKPDVLVMEVSYISPFTYEDRMKVVALVKDTVPGCKIALLCDENATPKIAERITSAKKSGLIDGFFYTSVSGEYLTAALDAL